MGPSIPFTTKPSEPEDAHAVIHQAGDCNQGVCHLFWAPSIKKIDAPRKQRDAMMRGPSTRWSHERQSASTRRQLLGPCYSPSSPTRPAESWSLAVLLPVRPVRPHNSCSDAVNAAICPDHFRSSSLNRTTRALCIISRIPPSSSRNLAF